MSELLLYYSPGTCSQIVLLALEQIGTPYRRQAIDFARSEQDDHAFRSINPLGKVPVLVSDGMALTETIGILAYLDLEYPERGVFPKPTSSLDVGQRYAGLSFCAANLHPLVRGVANPRRLTTGDVEPVREKTREVAHLAFSVAETRLARTGWWLDERSAVDAYLCWAFDTMTGCGFDGSEFGALNSLSARLAPWPAYQAMCAANNEARLGFAQHLAR